MTLSAANNMKLDLHSSRDPPGKHLSRLQRTTSKNLVKDMSTPELGVFEGEFFQGGGDKETKRHRGKGEKGVGERRGNSSGPPNAEESWEDEREHAERYLRSRRTIPDLNITLA